MSGTSGRTFCGACFCCRFYGAGFVQCQSSDSQVHSIPVPILRMVTDGSCTEMRQEVLCRLGCIVCLWHSNGVLHEALPVQHNFGASKQMGN